MEVVIEILKFGWDFIDVIVIGGDKVLVFCFGG